MVKLNNTENIGSQGKDPHRQTHGRTNQGTLIMPLIKGGVMVEVQYLLIICHSIASIESVTFSVVLYDEKKVIVPRFWMLQE